VAQKGTFLVNFRSIYVKKVQKNTKKCKKTFIFTLIFSPKTNKSYKITLFATANHPIFQNFSQKPLISQLFSLFFTTPYLYRIFSGNVRLLF